MAAYCWAVWFSRNKFMFQGKVIDPKVSAAKAESVVKAYQRVRKVETNHIDSVRKEKQQKWITPPENVFKINVDAAISNENRKVGLGAVIRNSNGEVIAAGINQTSLKESIDIAEAEAVQWGIQVARAARVNSLIVETDCLELSELLNNTKGSRKEIFWTISEIQKQRREFQDFLVRYAPRYCNTYAHALAKLALGKSTFVVWLDPIPAEVQNVLVVL